MSNADNQFKQGFTLGQFLDAHGDKLQGKVDKRGGDVTGTGYNTRAGAEWANLLDDMVKCAAEFGFGSAPPAHEWINNISSPVAIPVLSGPALDFIIDVPTNRNMLEMAWFSVTRQSATQAWAGLLRVTLASDAAFERVFASGVMEVQSDWTGLGYPSGSFSALFDEVMFAMPNSLMIGPFANALEEPSPGLRRFHLRMDVTGGPTSPLFFNYVVKAFDLTLPTATEFARPVA